METAVERYINKRGVNEGRIVLHSDLNNFFASVECRKRPELNAFPVAVCGNRADRHGIVLAKNEKAKKSGVKTAEAIWQAKQKCADLVIVPPDYDEYVRYSAAVKKIYAEYTDRVESFGMDEAWIELTGDIRIKTLEQGRMVAEEIRKKVKRKTGLTVSVGVSDNKIFSKLASDYKKPDAVTLFGPENYMDVVSKIPVQELLFVGRSTLSRLYTYGIYTVGELALTNEALLYSILGKNGIGLHKAASGENTSHVMKWGETDEAKSVGNSVTLPHDLCNIDEVHDVFHALAEKVAYRLRSAGFAAKTVSISVRSTGLETTEKQMPVFATSNAFELAEVAMKLYSENYDVTRPVRSVGLRATGLVNNNSEIQLSMFDTGQQKREKRCVIDTAVDEIRAKYGMNSILRVAAMKKMHISPPNATSFAKA